ncbi:MAG: 16S rRNA (uracil(1498)-N(3))-methyltransferase [Oligoflexales bacterium]|nr:16S rRNA (uracil(1498)-N(3))-methyltransferase [Oligoflexales bacterium]
MGVHIYRFFGNKKDDHTWEIAGNEINHANNVLRIEPGEIIEVCDGQGSWAVGSVDNVSQKEVIVRVTKNNFEARIANPIRLYIGVLRSASIDDLLPGLVEAGIDEIFVFFQEGTNRGIVSNKILDRWERIIKNSVKQCKRAWMPSISAFENIEKSLEKTRVENTSCYCLCQDGARSILDLSLDSRPISMVVGSEKGLDAFELELLRKYKFNMITIGAVTMKATTSALVATAVMNMKRMKRTGELSSQ